MSSARDYILLEYGGIPDGAVLSSQVCPQCKGGKTGETSLSVGRTSGMLWWRCHRNKCSFRGLQGGGPRHSQPLSLAQHSKGRWRYETEPLPSDWLSFLSKRFRILNEIVDREWSWTDSYGGRVVMPIRNERNITTGYTLRSYSGDSPKALIHRVMEDVGQAWYMGSIYPTHIMLVEDQPSALKASLSTGVNAVALLGTHIPDSLLETIRYRHDYGPVVVVALDQDATPEAVEAMPRLRRLYDKVKMLALEKDVKDTTEEEYLCVMNDVKLL